MTSVTASVTSRVSAEGRQSFQVRSTCRASTGHAFVDDDLDPDAAVAERNDATGARVRFVIAARAIEALDAGEIALEHEAIEALVFDGHVR